MTSLSGMLAPCPVCGSEKTFERIEEQTFPFGDKPVELSVRVPVIHCEACGFAYTDERAELIRHERACEYQGLVTPSDVRYVRTEIYRMSRKDFERAFGISEASLERWENGKLFPSRQSSILLRLLMDPTIGQRVVQAKDQLSPRRTESPADVLVEEGQFRSLRVTPAIEARAREFRLHPRTVH